MSILTRRVTYVITQNTAGLKTSRLTDVGLYTNAHKIEIRFEFIVKKPEQFYTVVLMSLIKRQPFILHLIPSFFRFSIFSKEM